LGSLGGTSGAATGINDAGDIAGWSYTNSGYQRAFFSKSGSNVLTVLNPLVSGGGFSYGFGVSGHLVVGESSYPAPRMNTAHATLWIVP
jgi:probable HAF family extracellular repeat protein